MVSAEDELLSDSLSLREAAEELGVHYMTVYRYVRLGMLPATKDGTVWRVDRNALREFRTPQSGTGRSSRDPSRWKDRFQARLVAADEAGAWAVIREARAGGMTVKEAYIEVLAPAMSAIGDLWQEGSVDVACEHLASDIAVRAVGRLGPQMACRGRPRGSVLIGTAQNERHSLPTAIFADLVRGEGFEAVDLGAYVPMAAFVDQARRSRRVKAIVIGLSAPGLEEEVRAITAALRDVSDAPIVVGGPDVGTEADALQLGADYYAPDYVTGLELLETVATA